MAHEIPSIESILAQLAVTPTTIAELTAGLSSAQLIEHPLDGEWSINDILSHLRGCADICDRQIMAMIRENHQMIRTTEPRSWAKGEGYREVPFLENLRAFERQRSALLRHLGLLAPMDWLRTATITGVRKEISIQSQGDWLARHERAHARQVKKVANVLRNA